MKLHIEISGMDSRTNRRKSENRIEGSESFSTYSYLELSTYFFNKRRLTEKTLNDENKLFLRRLIFSREKLRPPEKKFSIYIELHLRLPDEVEIDSLELENSKLRASSAVILTI